MFSHGAWTKIRGKWSVPFYSADRQRVLIPRGARVVGSVQAVAGADQERLAVAFHRII